MNIQHLPHLLDGSLGTDFSIFVEGDNMENLFSKAKNCFKAKKKGQQEKVARKTFDR